MAADKKYPPPSLIPMMGHKELALLLHDVLCEQDRPHGLLPAIIRELENRDRRMPAFTPPPESPSEKRFSDLVEGTGLWAPSALDDDPPR